jgi:hypothetical protein
LPGSMYPTETRNPGPAKASSLRQKLPPLGTASVEWTSGRLGEVSEIRQDRVVGVVDMV